jgi:hypothetical protein
MKNTSIFLLALFLLASCVKENIEFTDVDSALTPQFGVPLAKARIQTERIIEYFDDDGLLTTDGDGVLTLVYQDTLESISADEYLGLDDQEVSDTYEVGASALSDLINFGSVSFEEDRIYNLDFGDDRLDSIRFATGNLFLNINSDGSIPLSGDMSILDPFTGDVLLTASFTDATPPIAVSLEQDFSNQLFSLISNSEYQNGIRVAFVFELEDNGGTYPDEISVQLSFTDFFIASAGGYIAPRIFDLEEQSARVSIFEDDYNGQVRLEDPTLSLFFNNGFGIGVRPIVYEVAGTNNDDETLVVPGEQIESFPAIAAASSPGSSTVSLIEINNSSMTPTVTEFMSFQPELVSGRFGLEINPENDESNFISQASTLDVTFEVDLPIYGSIANFSLIDTTEINFGDLVESANDFSELEQIDVRLFVINALPIEAGVQLVFIDDDFNRIDSLFAEQTTVIPPAPVNLSALVGSPDYGKVTGTTETLIEVSIPRERIDPLEGVTQVIVDVYGNTTGNGDHPIRLYPEDFIEVNLAAKGIFNLELE